MLQEFAPSELKLRVLRTQPAIDKGRKGIVISDPMGISDKMVFVPGPLTLLLPLLDGTRDISALKTGFELRMGFPIGNMAIEQAVQQFDEALFLDNGRFYQAYTEVLNEYRSAVSRPPVLTGMCCPTDPVELRTFLDSYLEQPGNKKQKCPTGIKGIISPHIDYERGGNIYAKVWSQAKESLQDIELLIILGTDHNDIEANITLTYQSYETPWGIVATDKQAVDELAGELHESIFKYELHHRKEHSIEAALMWAHHLLKNTKCEMLPILCGSFQQFIDSGENPSDQKEIRSTIEFLRKLSGQRRTIIVAAADLAHQGPSFGDPQPLDVVGRARMAKHDEELVSVMCSGNADDFFTLIRKEGDRRHVCGLSPIYMMLSVLSGAEGTPVGYAQCPASEDSTSMVSICGILY
jgi:AmmeMemoRadiSam system protein B